MKKGKSKKSGTNNGLFKGKMWLKGAVIGFAFGGVVIFYQVLAPGTWFGVFTPPLHSLWFIKVYYPLIPLLGAGAGAFIGNIYEK